jgi:hypothetical protein
LSILIDFSRFFKSAMKARQGNLQQVCKPAVRIVCL